MSRGRNFRTNGESKRQARVSQLMAVEVSNIIRQGHGIRTAHKLPDSVRVKISVVDVSMSPDLRSANVFVSIYGSVLEKREAYAWCVQSSKAIRKVLASNLRNMKTVPELYFKKTDIGAAVDLMALIDKVSDEDEANAKARGDRALEDEDDFFFDLGDMDESDMHDEYESDLE
ncbi:unnamed protein product [Discosporangium mesarthrocarpum]